MQAFKASRAVQPTAWKVRFLRRLVRRSRQSTSRQKASRRAFVAFSVE
jgi:gentisate 1,2-dioxygenase